MSDRRLMVQLRSAVRRGLHPGSPAAFAFAILCVAAATLLRLAVDVIAPNAPAFATYYPTILVATLIGGAAAGGFAFLVSGLVAYWAFLPPQFEWSIPTADQIVGLSLFAVASTMIVWIAAKYRDVLRQLNEEEHYRQVVVDELGHRVKNKLATIYAILRHELRGHKDIWESVSGRLRALSVADDFLVRSDGKGVDFRQILEMELEPYGSARISLHGEPVLLFAKLPNVLALVFHELATNAAKYGALSVVGGHVIISWRASGDQIAVEWQEIGGPVVTAPVKRSFGSNLIERSLYGFAGSAKIEFAPGGVVCRIQFPKPKPPDAPTASAPPERTDLSSAAS
jgi:two-component sensor histidine kinase